jgi:hypothetical protein
MQKGYIALATIIIITAVVLAISSTVAFLAIGEAQSGLALFKGEDAITFSEGCMNDALLKARSDANYTGGNITRPEGTCIITVSKAGNLWTLTATTSVTTYKRTIQAIINRQSTGITLTSWQEI